MGVTPSVDDVATRHKFSVGERAWWLYIAGGAAVVAAYFALPGHASLPELYAKVILYCAVSGSAAAAIGSLELLTVAEGIDPCVLPQLIDIGCRSVQGFHFARPKPAAELTAMMLRQRTMPAVVPA